MIWPPSNFITRPDTQDAYTVREVLGYRRLNMHASDRVLDLGANIGAFTRMALDMFNVVKVVAVEPAPHNYKLLRKNLKGYELDVELLYGAVVGSDKRMVDVYLSTTGNEGTHTLIPTRGRETRSVPAWSFGYLLRCHRPTVIKCDIEGTEYDLSWLDLPAYVRAIAVECHFKNTRKITWRPKARKLIRDIESQGFKRVAGPAVMKKTLWHALYIWQR